MLNFQDIELAELVIHKVGNKIQEEPLNLSQRPVPVGDEALLEVLSKYFLTPFKEPNYYQFTHESDIELNEVYNYAHKIFADPGCFFLQSVNIAKHLYESTDHPNIKSGELYLAYFRDCVMGDELVDAIGLFKSENKDTYLKVYPQDNTFGINQEEGVNIKRLDKGCLIFNTEQEQGYKVCMVDNTNKGQEAQYWKDHFLRLKPWEDIFYHTQNYMDICKGFVEEVYNPEHNVDRADQIVMMNRSMDYFKEKEAFNVQEFENEVIQEPEVVEAFREYKEEFQEKNDVKTFDEFDISKPAVKGNKKNFKSVLKLDKNFHVYIHGDRDYIERGYDEVRDMHYYQLFFKQEG
ncbi:nucleoid-associated protein [Rapidithrix thailandica]|uniref:Nucleoid-associated protein n=1 Tax=Rapidithrix thailandica TaxID=413964 RepID=A0AAW9S644_9BACT